MINETSQLNAQNSQKIKNYKKFLFEEANEQYKREKQLVRFQ